MKGKKRHILFKSIDFGIKFEIILKIFIVALFSSLLMGSAAYKLFESSLILKEKKHLLSYRAFLDQFPSEEEMLTKLKNSFNFDSLWVLDKNYKFISGGRPPKDIPVKKLKSDHVFILKKGKLFTNYVKIYGLIPSSYQKDKLYLIGKDLRSLNNDLARLRKILLYIVLLTTVLIIILLNTSLKTTIIKPVDKIIYAINEIKEGNRKKLEGPFLREFNYLINSFNDLLQRIDYQKTLLTDKISELHKLNTLIAEYHQEMSKFEKLISIGELSAGIAHEIGNPLNNIQGYLSLIKDNSLISRDSELTDYISRIEIDTKRIHNIIRNILDFSRKEERLSFNPANLIEVIEKTIDLVFLRMNEKEIEIIRDYPQKRVKVIIDANRFQQVMLNLLSNAIDSIEKKGRVEVIINIESTLNPTYKRFFDVVCSSPPNSYVIITVKDTGKGIKSKDLQHVFDPFFTTKEPGKGTGLGLSVSLHLIKEMGGTLILESEKGEGTTARIILPYDNAS